MERIGQKRPASSEGREQSRQAQSALSTGSPSRSGVVGSGKSDASVRVLLTGRDQGEDEGVGTGTELLSWEFELDDASHSLARRVTLHVSQ